MQALPKSAQSYIALMLVLAVITLGVSVPVALSTPTALATTVALASLIALFDFFPVKYRENHFEITISTAVKLAGIMLFDPRIAVVSACAGTVVAEWRSGRAPIKKAFNVAVMTLTVTVQAALFLVLHDPASINGAMSLQQIELLVVLAFADIAFNTSSVALVIALVSRTPVLDHWEQGWRPLLLHEATMAPLAAFIVILWGVSPWAILFAAIPMVLVRNSYQLVGQLQRQTF